MGPMYEESNPALHEITLNGHTLTLNSEGTVWNYRFFLRGIKTVGDGRILMTKLGGVFYGPTSDLSSATLEVLSANMLSFEVSPIMGTFIDHRSTTDGGGSTIHSKVYVIGKYKPYFTAPMENFELGTETVKEVTLDLSELSEPFSTTFASPARELTFAAGAVITVEPGTRLPAAASEALQLVAWAGVPEGPTFVLPKALAKRGYRLDAREGGLFLCCDGMIIVVR